MRGVWNGTSSIASRDRDRDRWKGERGGVIFFRVHCRAHERRSICVCLSACMCVYVCVYVCLFEHHYGERDTNTHTTKYLYLSGFVCTWDGMRNRVHNGCMYVWDCVKVGAHGLDYFVCVSLVTFFINHISQIQCKMSSLALPVSAF